MTPSPDLKSRAEEIIHSPFLFDHESECSAVCEQSIAHIERALRETWNEAIEEAAKETRFYCQGDPRLYAGNEFTIAKRTCMELESNIESLRLHSEKESEK